MSNYPTIALLTDFGQEDWFVGTMHGVIRRTAPLARVVDLCHNIAPQNVRAAAFVLECSYHFFPDQTVFCSVVDPGVGTERGVVCATDGRHCFVAPDNGLLTLVAQRAGALWKVWRATNQRFFLPAVSATFQGRDVFAPLAAHLVMGVPLAEIGEPLDAMQSLDLHAPRVSDDKTALEGEVLYVDLFGNLITNIHRNDAAEYHGNLKAQHNWTMSIGGAEIKGLARTFGERKPGDALFYWGSAEYMEIAVNQGRAAERFGVAIGAPVRLTLGG